MKTISRRSKQTEFPWKASEVNFLPPPTVPPVSWAEARADYKRGPVIGSPSDVNAYLRKYCGGVNKEVFVVIYLDQRNHILDAVCEGQGTVDQTVVYPREILKRSLMLDATGIVLAHNHPGGSLTPSDADRQLTHQILTAARAMGITIHDHVIVAHEGTFSFRQAGMLG